VIVLDDGSTDGTAKILEHLGIASAWWRQSTKGAGSQKSFDSVGRGEWVQYLDADDYLLPGKIAQQVQVAYRGDCDGVYAQSLFDMNRPNRRMVQVTGAPMCSGTTLNGAHFKRAACCFAGQPFLRRWVEARAAVRQEHELILRMLLAGRHFLFLDRAETVYRIHGSSSVCRRDPLRPFVKGCVDRSDEEFLQETGRFTEAHAKALFVARMESARSCYSRDLGLARKLSRNATSRGTFWQHTSPRCHFTTSS